MARRFLSLVWLGVLLVLVACGPSVPSVSLHEASRTGKVELVKQHIKAKTDVNKKNAQGYAPLHLAAMSGHAEVVDALIGAGADTKALDPKKKTALNLAAANRHTDVVNLIQVLTAARPKTGGGRGLIDGGLGVSDAMNSF